MSKTGVYLPGSGFWYPYVDPALVEYQLEVEQPEGWHVVSAGNGSGALLPALGGGLARFGNADLLGISEFIGISLIYLGYRLSSPAPTAAPSAA